MRRAEHRNANVKRLGDSGAPGRVCVRKRWRGMGGDAGGEVRGCGAWVRCGRAPWRRARPGVSAAGAAGVRKPQGLWRQTCTRRPGIRSNLYLLHTWYKLLLIPSHRAGGARRVRRPGIRSKLYQVCNRYKLLLIPLHTRRPRKRAISMPEAAGVEPKPARPAGRLLVRGRPQPLLRPGPRRRWSPP